MKILHVSPAFYPATRWGGPIFSTKAICDGAARSDGFDVEVLTTDTLGPGEKKALPLYTRTVRAEAGYDVTYFPRQFGVSGSLPLLRALPAAVRSADIVHVTSTYSFPVLPTLAIAKAYGRPVVWSPRGAIQASAEWADAPNKKMKRAFEWIAQAASPARTILLVTAQSEAAATAARMPNMPIEIVPNGVTIPDSEITKKRTWRPNGKLRLVFLSRIHEKKGIDLLLEALSTLEDHIILRIYGDGDKHYIASLRARITALGLANRIEFRGHVDGAKKTEAFLDGDLFVLPSHSENFGIAVAEALAHGVPVITTTATPWTMLEKMGCGKTIKVDATELAASISSLAHADLERMGRLGRAWMEKEYSLEVVNERLLDVYRRAVGRQDDAGKPHDGATACFNRSS